MTTTRIPPQPQAKFRHFEAVDAARFNELWALQQAEAAALARKLLGASRVIHEQQLGWGWRGPDEQVRAVASCQFACSCVVPDWVVLRCVRVCHRLCARWARAGSECMLLDVLRVPRVGACLLSAST